MSTADKITKFLEAEHSPYPTECYAVPGSDSIIDTIHPVTGLTTYYGKTLDDVRAEEGYEQAERMTIEAFCDQKAARQDTPVSWSEVTAEQYDEMLGVLPPACYLNEGFLVGEPWDHHATTGRPRYAAYGYDRHTGKYYTASRPLTVKEFRDLVDESVGF